MDENPALAKLERLPPAMLEEFMQNPAAISPWARALLGLHILRMHVRMSDKSNPPTSAQQQAFLEFLAKVGDAFPKAQQQLNLPGNGFSVNIVLGAPQAPTKPIVIDNE